MATDIDIIRKSKTLTRLFYLHKKNVEFTIDDYKFLGALRTLGVLPEWPHMRKLSCGQTTLAAFGTGGGDRRAGWAYEQFINPGASLEINITSTQRAPLTAAYNAGTLTGADLKRHCYTTVMLNLGDPAGRFVKTEAARKAGFAGKKAKAVAAEQKAEQETRDQAVKKERRVVKTTKMDAVDGAKRAELIRDLQGSKLKASAYRSGWFYFVPKANDGKPLILVSSKTSKKPRKQYLDDATPKNRTLVIGKYTREKKNGKFAWTFTPTKGAITSTTAFAKQVSAIAGCPARQITVG